jgi:DNA-3-methyladenine glycosylase II
MPKLRRRDPGFAGLAQMSSSDNNCQRPARECDLESPGQAFDPFHHDYSRRTAARLGNSWGYPRQNKTLKAPRRRDPVKRLDLEALGEIGRGRAHKILTALHGVGPWTADVYLLFCLGHADAWPAGDLALQDAVRLGLNLDSRPTTKAMAPLAEIWRPYRGAAAHLWWAYYRAARNSAKIV